MAIIKIGNISYYYELHGEGPALVLISGFGADHLTWRAVSPRLTGRFRVLLFDNPASGRTRDGGGELTIEGMADSAAALFEALGLERPVLAGHSMGGSIALPLAARRPELARGLILINSAPRWGRRTLAALEGVIRSAETGMDLDSRIGILMKLLFGRKLLSDPVRAEKMRALFLEEPYPSTLSDLKRQHRALEKFDGTGLLSRIETPTLVVSGGEDIIAPPEEAGRLAAGIRGARLVRLPGGHVPQFECPDLLAEAILKFCDSQV